MAKRIYLLVLMGLLAACTIYQVREYNYWVLQERVRAEQGEIKWSDYYKGCFSRLADLPNRRDGKTAELEYYNTMIGVSLDYESGRIKQAEFESKRRLAQIAKARNMEGRESAWEGESGSIDLQTTY
jgi:hypothetical protein